MSLTSCSSGNFPYQLISDCFKRATHVFPEAAFLSANLLCEIGRTRSFQYFRLLVCSLNYWVLVKHLEILAEDLALFLFTYDKGDLKFQSCFT